MGKEKASLSTIDKILKFLANRDGHDKSLKFVQYGAKIFILLGKMYYQKNIPVAMKRFNNLYTVLRSSRFVSRLGYWINALSRVLTYINTGAIFKLSRDPYERIFELLDMLETLVQLLEGLLQDLVILSMFHALNPDINLRWRPLMNILWLICMLLSGVMMIRNLVNTVWVVETARLIKRHSSTDIKVIARNGNQSDKKPLRNRKKISMNTEAAVTDKVQTPNSPMSRFVNIKRHNSSRRLGVIDPDYATPTHRDFIVAEQKTNARLALTRLLPEEIYKAIKYCGDLTYCYADTLQVFGRDSTVVQWSKALGAMTSCVVALHLRWSRMFHSK
ncbi:hypothetical protein AAMO2058_000810900 [Amorphochlora amoebiformis]